MSAHDGICGIKSITYDFIAIVELYHTETAEIFSINPLYPPILGDF
jgi:hypothetical protein